jgi:hypothetical protein
MHTCIMCIQLNKNIQWIQKRINKLNSFDGLVLFLSVCDLKNTKQ